MFPIRFERATLCVLWWHHEADVMTTTPREHRLNCQGKNMYKYNKVVCLNRRPPTQKVASSSLAETIILIFNFSFSSLESKNYVRKTDICFVFLGKDPTGKKFFISFVK